MTEEYLGIVQVAPAPGGNIEYSRLRPTHVARNGWWQAISDPVRAFPDKGTVFWYKPNRAVRLGSMWAFGVTQQPTYDATPARSDRMQVAASERTRTALEAITLPEATDVRQFYRALASMTVQLPLRPVGRVLLRVPGSKSQWVGPIDPPANVGTLDPSQLLVVSLDGFLKVHDIPEDAFQEVEVDKRTHRLVRPTSELGAHSGYFSLQNDADLLRALFKRAKKWNPQLADIVEPTQQLIRAFEEGLTSEHLSEDERLREHARLRAARSLFEDLEIRLQLDSRLMELVVLELRSLPSVNAQIEAQQQQEFERERENVRNDAQDEMREAREAARTELEAARKELAEIQAAADRARRGQAELAAEMQATVEGIVAQAIPKLTEHALFRALHAQEHRPPTQVSSDRSDVHVLTAAAEIIQATTSAAAATHVDSYVLRVLTGLLTGTGLVLLGGATADRAALATAQLLASGSAVRVSVTPKIFSSSDLLNAPCSPVGEHEAHARTLGEFLRHAARQDHLSVVILQGCNRAPPEISLLELMELTAPPRSTSRLAWTNRLGEVEETSIDARVLFIGTLVHAETTFRIPVALAHRIPALWAERSVGIRAIVDDAAAKTPTRVTLESWRELSEPMPAVDEDMIRSLKQTISDAEPEAILKAYVGRVGAALGNNASLGFAEALASLVAGRASPEHLAQMTKQLPTQVRTAFDAAMAASHENLRRYYAQEPTA